MTGDGAARRSVWLTLSELFLDQDIDDVLPGVTGALKAAPFDVKELDRIMLDEVYPVLHWNLRSVAGEWAGFDPDWLNRRCGAQASLPEWRKALFRGLRRFGLRRLVPEWAYLLEELRRPD